MTRIERGSLEVKTEHTENVGGLLGWIPSVFIVFEYDVLSKHRINSEGGWPIRYPVRAAGPDNCRFVGYMMLCPEHAAVS